jgi:superfamily II DNA helicase RecQ
MSSMGKAVTEASKSLVIGVATGVNSAGKSVGIASKAVVSGVEAGKAGVNTVKYGVVSVSKVAESVSEKAKGITNAGLGTGEQGLKLAEGITKSAANTIPNTTGAIFKITSNVSKTTQKFTNSVSSLASIGARQLEKKNIKGNTQLQAMKNSKNKMVEVETEKLKRQLNYEKRSNEEKIRQKIEKNIASSNKFNQNKIKERIKIYEKEIDEIRKISYNTIKMFSTLKSIVCNYSFTKSVGYQKCLVVLPNFPQSSYKKRIDYLNDLYKNYFDTIINELINVLQVCVRENKIDEFKKTSVIVLTKINNIHKFLGDKMTEILALFSNTFENFNNPNPSNLSQKSKEALNNKLKEIVDILSSGGKIIMNNSGNKKLNVKHNSELVIKGVAELNNVNLSRNNILEESLLPTIFKNNNPNNTLGQNNLNH